MAQLVPLAARRSDRIVTPSRSTRNDIVRLLGTAQEKVDVVPLGVQPPPSSVDDREIRRRFELGDARILLTASAKRPHKNLRALLDALFLLPEERRPVLLLPGYPTPHETELTLTRSVSHPGRGSSAG